MKKNINFFEEETLRECFAFYISKFLLTYDHRPESCCKKKSRAYLHVRTHSHTHTCILLQLIIITYFRIVVASLSLSALGYHALREKKIFNYAEVALIN